MRPSDSSVDCSKAASSRSTSTGPAVRSASASRASCSGVSLARARTSAAVVRRRHRLVAVELAEQECERALIGFGQAARARRPARSSRSSSGFLASAAIRSRRAGSSPAVCLGQRQGARGRDGQWNQLGVERSPSSTLARRRDPARRHLLFASVPTRPWPAGCSGARPAGRRRRATERPGAPGSAPPARSGRAAVPARPARRRGRSVRSSRSPRTPASAPAHSRCRPTIHDAVSLRPGSAEASSPATNLRVEPAAVHLVEGDHRGARAARVSCSSGRPRSPVGIGDLDQGISERMFEHAVGRLAGGLQQRGHGCLLADSPQRLGSGAAVVQRRRFEAARSVAARPRRSRQRPANESPPGGPSRRGRERKARTSARAAGWSIRASVQTALRRSTGDGSLDGDLAKHERAASFCQRPAARASIARRCTAGRGSPSSLTSPRSAAGVVEVSGPLQQRLPPRVVDLRRTLPPDSIDRPQHVGLVELRRRAAELVPAAGVDHDQAAVGVLEHVGRVEIEVGAGDEVFVLGRERGAVGRRGRAG